MRRIEDIDGALAEKLYVEREYSLRKIAAVMDTSHVTIAAVLDRRGVTRRDRRSAAQAHFKLLRASGARRGGRR